MGPRRRGHLCWVGAGEYEFTGQGNGLRRVKGSTWVDVRARASTFRCVPGRRQES